MVDMSEQDGGDDVRRAKLREMALGRHHLNDGVTAKMLVQVL
jgi:hypothetical protein